MAKLVYDHLGEWRLELETDGRVFVRDRGAPLSHMGHVYNAEVPTVSAWRARLSPARAAVLFAGFHQAGSTKGCDYSLIPDERGSSMALEEPGAPLGRRTIGVDYLPVTQRSLASNAALARVVTELGGVAGALRASPPMDRLENPDREVWSRVPPAMRRPGTGAPAPQPGAEELGQAAVDRFYAVSLGARLASVQARASTSASAASPPRVEDAEHTFTCKQTGQPAGTVTLRLEQAGGRLEGSDFSTLTGVTIRVSPRDLPTVHRQLVAGDARSIWNLDEKLAPFYCPQCDACFAANQWKIYATSSTRVEGMCPLEHRRRMRAG